MNSHLLLSQLAYQQFLQLDTIFDQSKATVQDGLIHFLIRGVTYGEINVSQQREHIWFPTGCRNVFMDMEELKSTQSIKFFLVANSQQIEHRELAGKEEYSSANLQLCYLAVQQRRTPHPFVLELSICMLGLHMSR
jgi:hypothetical protein